jgi:hypothetical protein
LPALIHVKAPEAAAPRQSLEFAGRTEMSDGETLYLALVIVTAITFAAILAWG